jgi:predicted Zn-dependent protease
LEDINKGISLRPKSALFYEARAMYNALAGNRSEAISDFKNAARLYPDGPERLAVLGQMYLLQGQKEKGIVLLQKAARMGHKATQVSLTALGVKW